MTAAAVDPLSRPPPCSRARDRRPRDIPYMLVKSGIKRINRRNVNNAVNNVTYATVTGELYESIIALNGIVTLLISYTLDTRKVST